MKNLELLLSKERLKSYKSVKEHFENLTLIARFTPKLATLEIILRNLLDKELSKTDFKWIENSKDKKIQEQLFKIKNKENAVLNHHQYLSRLTLGIIIETIRKEKLQNKIINLNNIRFKRYDKSNREYFYLENKKSFFNNINKVDIVLSLLHNLRNRCYHWENIKKLRQKNGTELPRLTTMIKGTFIGLHPDKIEFFLEDLLKQFNKNLIKHCKI